MLGVNNAIDYATFPGGYGSWLAGLPLTNLQNRVQGIVARSTSATAANSKFKIELYTTANPVRIVGIFNHNISTAGTIRIRAWTTSGYTVSSYDSGTLSVFPSQYSSGLGTQLWNISNMMKNDYIHVLSSTITSRWWTIEIVDTTNIAGYIDIGRLFIGPAWQPTHNFNFGQSISTESSVTVNYTLDNTLYYNYSSPYPMRVANFTLACLSETEAMEAVFDLVTFCDLYQEVVYIYDPSDTTNMIRRRFMGTLRKLSAIEQPEAYNNFSASFEIKEAR